MGSFLLDGGATVGEYYDDNIFATHTNLHHDYVTVVSPYVRLKSTWTRNALNFDAGADLGRYKDHHTENYNDYHLGTDGRLDLTGHSNLFGGASFDHLHESRESPDAVNGINPTTYNDTQTFLGTLQQVDAWRVRFGGTFQRLDFNNVSSTTGTINNNDRDRNIYELGGRVSHPIAPGFDAFVQGAWNWRRYDATVDDNGFRRDSHGASVDLGLLRDLPNRIQAEIYGGYLWQSYEDTGFRDITAFDFGGQLKWQVAPATRVTSYVDRTVEETTLFGSPGYLYTVAGLGVDHDLHQNLALNVNSSYGIADYQNSNRSDRFMNFGMGFRYFITPHVFIGPEYRFFRRDSNTADANYDDNQIWLRLGAQLASHQNVAGSEAVSETASSGTSGFYIGTQAEHEQLHTKLTGPRGSGGSLSANFGNTGFGGGLFGGYGVNVNRWYLGVEADGSADSVKWTHSRSPGGRVYDVTQGASYSAGARIGYWLPRGALAYARLGIALTKFDTNYRTASGRLFPQTNDRYGPRVGLGLEAPLTSRLFLRLDYTYTDYGDYDVTVPSGTDNFRSSENAFRLGIGYRFNDAPKDESQEPASPNAYRGFYAGPVISYTSLDATNSGARTGGSTLVADRAKGGPAGGVVAGMGTVFGRWYLGAELDGRLSAANWSQTRDPTGRVYSVRQTWGAGAAVRVGYVLPAGNTLVYGRIGPALRSFKTDYQDETATNFVQQRNTLTGVRYGLGVEVPAGDRWFLRADYTYVKYPGYTVKYGTGADRFVDTSESTFDLGLMYRF